MGCKRYQKHIALDAGGDLSARASQVLKAHVATCAACRQFAEAMHTSHRALARWADGSVGPMETAAFRDALSIAVAKEVRDNARRARFRPSRLAWVGVGVVVCGVAAGLWPRVVDAPVPTAPTEIAEAVPPAAPSFTEKSSPIKDAPVLSQIHLQTSDPNVVIILVANNREGMKR